MLWVQKPEQSKGYRPQHQQWAFKSQPEASREGVKSEGGDREVPHCCRLIRMYLLTISTNPLCDQFLRIADAFEADGGRMDARAPLDSSMSPERSLATVVLLRMSASTFNVGICSPRRSRGTRSFASLVGNSRSRVSFSTTSRLPGDTGIK